MKKAIKNLLIYLAKCERFCNLLLSDKQNRKHDFPFSIIGLYIRAAGGRAFMVPVFVAIHRPRLFFCPYLPISSFQNSDK